MARVSAHAIAASGRSAERRARPCGERDVHVLGAQRRRQHLLVHGSLAARPCLLEGLPAHDVRVPLNRGAAKGAQLTHLEVAKRGAQLPLSVTQEDVSRA